MLVPAAMIVVCVDHTQVLTQLVHDTIDLAADIGVARIEANAHIDSVHGGQNPKKIAGLSKQKMGQLVFQHTGYAKFLATFRNPIQSVSGTFQPIQTFLLLF
jgi:hypothetical protein